MLTDEIKLLDYEIHYPTLNLSLKKENEKAFDLQMIYGYLNECKRGFKVKKVSKTSTKGTNFTYEAIKDYEDFKKYKSFIDDEINKLNKKYGLHLYAKEVEND